MIITSTKSGKSFLCHNNFNGYNCVPYICVPCINQLMRIVWQKCKKAEKIAFKKRRAKKKKLLCGAREYIVFGFSFLQ